MLIIFTVILGWIFCGFLGMGFYIHHFQTRYPSIAECHYREDFRRALWQGLIGGPCFMLVSLIGMLRHPGFRIRPLTHDECADLVKRGDPEFYPIWERYSGKLK
jgi:hypothetical protein